MKKYIYLLLFLWIGLPQIQADIHRIGTYNIRTVSDKDTGDKAWVNRRESVARIIAEKGYDIIGLQEMKDAQHKDLKSLLPDYGLEYWGRDSYVLGNVGEGVGVAWLNSRYTLLDKGHFFLSEDPTKPEISWDAAYRRVSVWVKLQDKNSDEILYYCSTHLDNNGAIARQEGARINVETMLGIAGNSPCFIVGDFNTAPGNSSVHYTFGAYFDDSRLMSATAPTGQEGTYSNWALSFGSNRIDYIYCRKAKVWSYATINEDFGRGLTPSDHFPVQITVSLQDPDVPSRIYVSTDGDDANDGTALHPLRTLQKAIDLSHKCDTIYTTHGTFFVGDTPEKSLLLPHSLCLSGGYNNDFTRIDGKTILSGNFTRGNVQGDNSHHLITVNAPGWLQIENFILQDACSTSDTSEKGGAIQAFGLGIKAIDTEFANNRTEGYGAAIYSSGKVVLEDCKFYGNKASKGGALYIDGSSWGYTVHRTLFDGNDAASGAAIHINGTAQGYLYGNSFIANSGSQQGAFCFNDVNTDATITFVNNTFANNLCHTTNGIMNPILGGSAVYIYAGENSTVSLVNNTLSGNQTSCLKTDGNYASNFYGAAVYCRKGKIKLYNNIVAGNFSTAETGGDVYIATDAELSASGYNLFTSRASTNLPVNATDLTAMQQEEGMKAVEAMLEGSRSETKFNARLTESSSTPYIRFKTNEFDGKAINTLSAGQLSETDLDTDIDNDGKRQSSLLYDQIGVLRPVAGSTIGAIEYDTQSAVGTASNDDPVLRYKDGKLMLNADCDNIRCTIYNTAGQIVFSAYFKEKTISLESVLPAGYYIACITTKGKCHSLKFTQRAR